MYRRQVLAAGSGLTAFSLAGCGERASSGDSGSTDGESGDASGDTSHARSGAGVPGRIEPLGHAIGSNPSFYTAAALSPDAEWGLLGGFPTESSAVASTLVDLAEPGSPTVVHELDATADGTRTNAVGFDAHRAGLYYRSLEGTTKGIEVVDCGWREGTPTEPRVVTVFETPNVGVHRFVAQPAEPVLYLVDHHPAADAGVLVVDVSAPGSPELVGRAGTSGGTHDLTYDPDREMLYAAYAVGPDEGVVVYDAANPYVPTERGRFAYGPQPDYAALGEPGFETCHQVDYDPTRDLLVVGDERRTGIPGGKHVFDVGWDRGSLEKPEPIGFTHAPDARPMGEEERFWWTTHFHDVVSSGDETLLVDGGYRQGAWVCNLTEPREPTPTERFATVAGADSLDPDPNRVGITSPPFAWEAVHATERDFVFVSDSLTGAYTVDVSAAEARGPRGRGPAGHYNRRIRPGGRPRSRDDR
ncbi:LVIVD repeat-containing protein [Halovivax cerinus]|uniref:LVIVD repeat-containing protein n=1 Tax=Halovivax cerinus TaxID=1487865 RepID=A0ABD5NQ21_9EURY|nr:regulatory P domain-containing protein [Halovivax cerinus]